MQTEPAEARGRTAGFSEAGALRAAAVKAQCRRRAWGGAGITAGGGPEAPPRGGAYGHPAGEPCRWRWGTEHPHSPRVASGARSLSPEAVTCLKAGSPAAAWQGKED